MSKSKEVNVGCGLSLPFVITVIFVILKLTETISWDWIWVFSPLWIYIGVVLFFWLFFMTLGTLIMCFFNLNKNKFIVKIKEEQKKFQNK